MKLLRPCTAGCGGWSGWRGGDVGGKVAGLKQGDSKLRAHFRETHLFPLSSPDGKESLSQDPAGCHSYWKYTR